MIKIMILKKIKERLETMLHLRNSNTITSVATSVKTKKQILTFREKIYCYISKYKHLMLISL